MRSGRATRAHPVRRWLKGSNKWPQSARSRIFSYGAKSGNKHLPCGRGTLGNIGTIYFRRNGLKRGSDQFDARSYTAAGRVNRRVIAIPRMIVSPGHCLPIG
jgi:hypothetical protein